jgi:hypothetical protein
MFEKATNQQLQPSLPKNILGGMVEDYLEKLILLLILILNY